VVTARQEDADEVLKVFGRHGLTAAVIGKITEDRRLSIFSGEDREVLFDFATDRVTGIR
jgi:selenophosphate synthetase-related protein